MSKALRKLRTKAEKLHAAGRIREAIPLYQKAIAHKDAGPMDWYSIGVCSIAIGDYKLGCEMLEAALQFDPDSVTAWYNLGMSYDAQGKLDDAKRCYLSALKYRPGFILAHTNLGSIYYREGDPEQGYYHHSKALEPENADDEEKAGRALIRLLRGDYEKGWDEYESRWKLPMVLEKNPRPTTGRRWYGEPLEGKPLLIWHEQGLGDTLMMARYLDAARFVNGPGMVTVMVQPGLKRLMSQYSGYQRVIERGEDADFYWHAPFMSLAGCLGVGPVWGPYLRPIPGAAPKLPATDKLTVGIYWQGSRGHMNDKDRSCPFNELLPLFKVKGIRWVSLQTPAEPNTLERLRGPEVWEMPLDDFAETAGVIDQLDMVITVDSAVGHLAGAMGIRTWLMTPSAPEFRWGLEGETTPWYPNHKLYRRTSSKAWPELIQRIATDLKLEVENV